MANVRFYLDEVAVSYPEWGFEFRTERACVAIRFDEIRGFSFAQMVNRVMVNIIGDNRQDIELEHIKLDEGDVVVQDQPFPWTVKIQAHFDKYLKSKLKHQTQTQNLTQIQQRLDKLEDTFTILANLLTRVDEQQK